MVDDAKITFYLTHRELIEEWAALAERASEALDHALVTAGHSLVVASEEDLPQPRFPKSRETLVCLDITTEPLPLVYIEIGWNRRKLLRHTGATWPSLRLVTSPDNGRALQAVLCETSLGAAVGHGMGQTSTGWWVRFGELAPAQEPIDIEDFAAECIERFIKAYRDLRQPIHEAVTRFAADSSQP